MLSPEEENAQPASMQFCTWPVCVAKIAATELEEGGEARVCVCVCTYTQDVKPGKARVIKCLLENMAQPNFGEDCKNELQEREHVMQSDYRSGRPTHQHTLPR